MRVFLKNAIRILLNSSVRSALVRTITLTTTNQCRRRNFERRDWKSKHMKIISISNISPSLRTYIHEVSAIQ